jgi:hypothetical protein
MLNSKQILVSRIRRAVADPKEYQQHFLKQYSLHQADVQKMTKYVKVIDMIERETRCKVVHLLLDETCLFDRWAEHRSSSTTFPYDEIDNSTVNRYVRIELYP